MDGAALGIAVVGFVLHEATLFAACGFLLLGLSDLLVDMIWLAWAARRRCVRFPRACAATLSPPLKPGLHAIFIPAWDEADVIGDMLRHTLAVLGQADYRLYVGCYRNDPATIGAVNSIGNAKLRPVINDRDGPTTKADCLNRLWHALLADELADGRRAKTVVLHDAEDVVHPAELTVFDLLIERFDLVQLPVLPILDGRTSAVSATYADEFAQSHGKELVVREAVGAGLPSAGVGCAFARDAIAAAARLGDGNPFQTDSLTEDYELGLRLHATGGRAAFVRLPQAAGGPVVATREYFPGTIRTAVNQKARWITGIALSGWDRLGWNCGPAETWMRMRDRQPVFAALLLGIAYLSFALWLAVQIASVFTGIRIGPVPAYLQMLLVANFGLLLWRLGMRAGFVAQAYGWRQAFWSIPRTVLGNLIAVLAAREAVRRYLRLRRTGSVHWNKTAHHFPTGVPAE